jgi:hypothetical protein
LVGSFRQFASDKPQRQTGGGCGCGAAFHEGTPGNLEAGVHGQTLRARIQRGQEKMASTRIYSSFEVDITRPSWLSSSGSIGSMDIPTNL